MKSISKAGDRSAVAEDVRRFRDLLIRLGGRRSLRDPLAGIAEEALLTAPQCHALFWLGLGPLTMGDLARRIGVTEKTVTGVVDRLERDEYVRRERSVDDRRVVHVALARKGQACFRELDEHLNHAMGEMLQVLDADDRLHLFRVLEKLVRPPEAADAKPVRSHP